MHTLDSVESILRPVLVPTTDIVYPIEPVSYPNRHVILAMKKFEPIHVFLDDWFGRRVDGVREEDEFCDSCFHPVYCFNSLHSIFTGSIADDVINEYINTGLIHKSVGVYHVPLTPETRFLILEYWAPWQGHTFSKIAIWKAIAAPVIRTYVSDRAADLFSRHNPTDYVTFPEHNDFVLENNSMMTEIWPDTGRYRIEETLIKTNLPVFDNEFTHTVSQPPIAQQEDMLNTWRDHEKTKLPATNLSKKKRRRKD